MMNEKEMNKNIGLAKRIYTNDKKASFAVDKISRAEAKFFVNDEFLAEKVAEKQEIDRLIIEHISETLKNERKSIDDEDKEKMIAIKCGLEDLAMKCNELDYEFMKEINSGLVEMVNAITERVIE